MDISGVGGTAEDQSVIGRRDLFRLPGGEGAGGRGRGGPARGGPGRRPPLNNRRPPVHAGRYIEEEKKQPSSLAQGAFEGDFNLFGTQIGVNPSAAAASNVNPPNNPQSSSRISFRSRHQSQNNRVPQEEQKLPRV